MKHIWKKAACALLAAVCIFSFTACGGSKDAGKGQIDEQRQTTLLQSAEGLSDAVVHLSEEEIKSYKESGDEFTEGVMEAWEGSREDLGDFKEFKASSVELDGTEYIVTIPGTFKKANAEFIYIFDKTMTPKSLSINVQYPMAVTLERAGLNTLMGLCTVFVILIFLSFIISLFKYIPNPELKKKEAAKAAAPAPVAAAPVSAVADETDDTELVAVIAAAIAAAEGTSPDGFVVRSIRKVNRKKW